MAFVAGLIALALLQSGAATDDEQITVTGQRQELARAFVSEVAATPGRQIPLWERRICPGVTGISERQAQFFADRISQHAEAVGLGSREPRCAPNVLIIFSARAGERARELAAQHGRLMGRNSGHTLGRAALQDFVETPRAVRWWHVTEDVDMNGVSRRTNPPMLNAARRAVGRGMRVDFANTPSAGASRLRASTHPVLSYVTIIVDAPRISELVRLDVLADYLAMVALAQIDPAADTRAFDTVLNTFTEIEAGHAVYTGLTAWDEGFLRGLYSASPDVAAVQQRQADIARIMVDPPG